MNDNNNTGTPVPPVTNNMMPNQGTYVEQVVPHDSKNKKLILILVLLIILFLGVILGYKYLNSNNNIQDTVTNKKVYKAEIIDLNKDLDDTYLDKLINDKVVLYRVKDKDLSIMRFIKINGKKAVELRRKVYSIDEEESVVNIDYYKARYLIEIVDGIIKTGEINVPYYEDEEEKYYRPDFTITSNNNKLSFVLNSTDEDNIEDHRGYEGEYIALKSEDSYMDFTALFNDNYSGQYIRDGIDGSIELVLFPDGRYFTYGRLWNNKYITSINGFTEIKNGKGKADGVEFTLEEDKMTITKATDIQREVMLKEDYQRVVHIKAKDYIEKIDRDFNLDEDEEGTSYYGLSPSYR